MIKDYYHSLEEHLASLADGLRLLVKLVSVSTNELNVLKQQIDLISHKERIGTLIWSLDDAYSNLLCKMKQDDIEKESKGHPHEFDKILPVMGNLMQVNEFILENIKKLVKRKADQPASFTIELEDITKRLTCLTPLLIYEASMVDIQQEDQELSSPLVALLNNVTHSVCLFWICIKDNEETILAMNDKLSRLCDETELMNTYLGVLSVTKKTSKSTDRDAPLESEFTLLHNMVQLLDTCAESSNAASTKLLKELKLLTAFFAGIPEKERLQRLHYFELSIEVVCNYSIPILYKCNVKEIEKSIARELDGSLAEVVDQIEQTKLEVAKIKLYYYPKTDGLGFLGLFLGQLEELLTCRPDAIETMKGQIETLYSGFDLLISVFKITQEKHGEVLWTHILHLAYQAEYLIDSYLARGTPSNNIISALSEVSEQVNPVKTKAIMECLVGGHRELDVIWMPSLEGTTLAMSIFKDYSVVRHFDVRAWCTMSKKYENRELLLAVLTAIIGQTDSVDELSHEELAEKLCNHLEQHKFLIFLEDVSDINLWNEVKRYLVDSQNGSRVLITTRLQASEIEDCIKVDAFRSKSVQSYNINKSSKSASSVSQNDIIVGLKFESETIMNCLIGGELEKDVISIFGMPGIGKTTLALSLYNGFPKGHFDVQAWCTVSQNYQKGDLLLTILGQIDQSASGKKFLDDQELADRVCKSLRRRRYLIVPDDVWDIKVWNDLKHYFPDDKNSSRILVTTRHQTVASYTQGKIHALSKLIDEECSELLQQKLLEGDNFSPELLHIAKRIAKSCKGLPLSVIIAGLLLKVEKIECKWKEIAESVTSHVLADNESSCMTILDLSYNHLPDHLKSCFLYLGAFPEDHDIPVSRLKLLWIGEGFVRESKSESLEEAAETCLMDLIGRSLITPEKQRFAGGLKTCNVHDLLHDFCMKKADEEHFLRALSSSHHSLRLDDPCRLSISNCFLEDFAKLSCHSVRSLLMFHRTQHANIIDSKISYGDLVLIKVFDAVMNDMPSYWPALIHLKYFAIRGELRNDSISESIKRLHNLQILIVINDSNKAMKVPDPIFDMDNMVNLRHVYIRPYASFIVDPKRFLKSSSWLENLQKLSKVCLSCGEENTLKMLPNLRELNCIFLDYWVDSRDVNKFPKVNLLSELTSLKVEYGGGDCDDRKRCELQLPRYLKKLSLSKFRLSSEDISEFGKLGYLESLKFYQCNIFNSTWNVNEEDFQTLKHLKCDDMEFKEWNVPEESFPCLEQLLLYRCFDLKSIPLSFGEIPFLRRMEVVYCSFSAGNSARVIEKMQREETLNEELQVRIRSRWTPAMNKAFECAVAIYDEDTPDRWFKITSMLPGMSVNDVIQQYNELVEDISTIEAGVVPLPDYPNIHDY